MRSAKVWRSAAQRSSPSALTHPASCCWMSVSAGVANGPGTAIVRVDGTLSMATLHQMFDQFSHRLALSSGRAPPTWWRADLSRGDAERR